MRMKRPADPLGAADPCFLLFVGFVAARPLRAGEPTRSVGAGRPAGAGIRARRRRAGPAGPVERRPAARAAAPGQHLRQLVRALQRRGAAARRARAARRADRRHRGARPARGPRRASSPATAIRSSAIGADVDRRVQLTLGSSGVPETFVIDGQGVIRHQHIGAITPQRRARRIVAALCEAAR